MTIDRLLLLSVGSCFGKGWGRHREGWKESGNTRKILKVWPRGQGTRAKRSQEFQVLRRDQEPEAKRKEKEL